MKQDKLYSSTTIIAAAVFSILLLVFVIEYRSSYAASLWYVAPGGNDNNDCASPGTPCATINPVFWKPTFTSGDTVLVAKGIYTGTGNEVVYVPGDVTLSGGWESDFSVQNGISTIDGEGVRIGLSIDSYMVNTEVKMERFAIRNCFGAGIDKNGILIMTDCVIHDNNGNGIENAGPLTLTNCTVRDNITKDDGGGIYQSFGVLELINSTVKDNEAGRYGGGIAKLNDWDELIITNSTISNNSAGVSGGGIFISFAVSPQNINISSSTISGNTAEQGGGIYREPVPNARITAYDQEIQNSILAGNTGKQGSPDCFGVLSTGGYNLIGDISGCIYTAGQGDLTDTDAMLLPLDGSPSYHPLMPSSPAINAGNPTGCKDFKGNLLLTDQRGVSRQGRCDIGAYEYDGGRYVFMPLLAR